MRVSFLLFSLLILSIGVAGQSKDDEEVAEFVSPNGKRGGSHIEGSANAPSDDEDVVEGSGLPVPQVYASATTIKRAENPIVFQTTTPRQYVEPHKPIIVPEGKDRFPDEKDTSRIPDAIFRPEVLQIEELPAFASTPLKPATNPRMLTTMRPDSNPIALSKTTLIALLASIIVLIIVVIVIIVVCRRKTKSGYTPGRQDE